MAGGPLPNPQRRRRNEPTIPTTDLPVDGWKGRIPKCPYGLAAAGSVWWKWAWKLPQAAAWDEGAVYFVARRAVLEDVAAAPDFEDYSELRDLLAGADKEAVKRVEFALATLKRSASGLLAVQKEMRELDNRLGLNPKALADLRWSIVAEESKAPAAAPSKDDAARRARLSVVA